MNAVTATAPSADELKRLKADYLKTLMSKKPGQKHYKRSLRAFLEIDAALERALEESLGLN